MAEEKNGAEATKKQKRPTPLKRDIQNERKNLENRSFKSRVKTSIQSLQKGIAAKESKEVLDSKLKLVYSLMDKGVKKGVFKKNKASRVKANYSSRVSA